MSSPAAVERRRQRQEEARRAILEAAESLLLEEGVEGFTMRKLADRCGYTAPTLYHYFGDKHLLLDTLLEEAFRGLVLDLERAARCEDPLDAVRVSFHAILRFGIENPRYYRFLASRPADAAPLPSEEESRGKLEAPLARVFAEGRLRSPDLESARQALWALLHGLISLQTLRPHVVWSGHLAEVALESMLTGLLAPDREGA